jgi:hypothetical protein
MCYERRRAEACVDESAQHALGPVYYCTYVCVFITAGPSTKMFYLLPKPLWRGNLILWRTKFIGGSSCLTKMCSTKETSASRLRTNNGVRLQEL